MVATVTTSPRPIVALSPPPPLPNPPPLPIRLSDWEMLQTYLHNETIAARATFKLAPNERSYLLTLEDAVTLQLSRPNHQWFGMRIPSATVWPLTANRVVEVTSHTRKSISISWLSETMLRCVFGRIPRLRKYFVEQIGLANAYAQDKLMLHLNKSARCRLAEILLELDGDSFPKPIQCGHNALGIMLNLNRETVSSLLNEFRRSGWVSLGYRRINLTNRHRLTQVAAMF